MQGLAFDLKETVRNLNPRTWDWRNIGTKSVPLLAATGGACAALIACKQVYQPRPNRLLKEACKCTPLDGSTTELCLKSLRSAGADLLCLCRAASQFMGPLERDLFLVEYGLGPDGPQAIERLQTLLGDIVQPGDAKEMRRRLYAALLEKWSAQGYLQPPPTKITRHMDPRKQVVDNYGYDIGCELPRCFLREKGDPPINTLTGSSWDSAAMSLEKDGLVLLRSLLPSSRIAELRDKLGVHMSAMDRQKPSGDSGEFPPVREFDIRALLEVEPELEPGASAHGRKHFKLRGTALESLVSDVQAGLLPLVWEHLSKIAAQRGLPQTKRAYLSEVQLLVSYPCALEQFWHADNISAGLSVVVPLTSVKTDIGATQFMYGTHHLFNEELSRSRRLQKFLSSFLSVDGSEEATMQAGDALVYDSRVIHKTGVNRSYNRTRVDLVFRYDFERPPGVTWFGTTVICFVGKGLGLLQSMYSCIPCRSPAEN